MLLQSKQPLILAPTILCKQLSFASQCECELFLRPQTSRMYTVPLYEDMVAGVMKCAAVEIFYQTQSRLHPNLKRTLQQILFQTSSTPVNQNEPSPSINITSSSSHTPPPPQPGTTTPANAIALRDMNVLA